MKRKLPSTHTEEKKKPKDCPVEPDYRGAPAPVLLNHFTCKDGMSQAEAVRHLFGASASTSFGNTDLNAGGTLYSIAAAQASWEGVNGASSPLHLPDSFQKAVTQVFKPCAHLLLHYQ